MEKNDREEFPNLVGVFKREFPLAASRANSGEQMRVRYYDRAYVLVPAQDKNNSPYNYRVFAA
jgi:hypothetical protein